ncbi:diguanylate cyclase (GGDEF)-like protein [Salsuginibacillus halophilus]|uniref:Diguanylate cyclase (GGDEF)-like protein n=1 Tax=Salsuginibacillus halophilus TaxID=517424 RepID=A0A2P8HL63_9BACI|nr:GGDEF domain-containing protein [Salsuginibacillus halophilus]PSL46962.1 diguanylate cyclase (GGDEF)-like protein [Salsuginibacillus halophilus]
MQGSLFRTLSISFIIILVLIFGTIFLSGAGMKFSTPNATLFDEGWSYSTPDTTGNLTEMPTKLPVQPNETMTLSRSLSSDFEQPRSILFRSSLQEGNVFLDGELIYQGHEGDDAHGLNLPLASRWGLVELPAGSDGQLLELHFSSPYPEMSGTVNPIYTGSSGSLQMHVIQSYLFNFLYAVSVLLLGFIFTAVYFVFRKLQPAELLYLGLLSIILSLWFIAESRMLQFFTDSQFLIGGLGYLMVPLIPIPMILYARDIVLTQRKAFMTFLSYLFLAQFFFVLLLQLFGIRDFFQSVTLTLFFVITASVIILYYVVKEVFQKKSQAAKFFLAAIGVLTFFSWIEIFMFFAEDPLFATSYVRVGFFMMITLLAGIGLKNLLTRIRHSYEAGIYKELAFKDPLVQGWNRLAFDRDTNRCFAPDQLPPYRRLIYFDLNDLKKINDIYGHCNGDEIIQLTFSNIQAVFGVYGRCYRLGGDEFAVLLTTDDETLYHQLVEQFESQLDAAGTNLPYKLEVSIGTAVLNRETGTQPGDWMHRADQAMYTDKAKRKHKAEA